MDWATFAEALLQLLLPEAITIWQAISSGGTPSAADWAALVAATGITSGDLMKAQLAAAGIPLDDPKALALIALASDPNFATGQPIPAPTTPLPIIPDA